MSILYTVLFMILFVISCSLYVLYQITSANLKDLENENRLQADELKRINGKLSRLELKFNNINVERNKIEIIKKYDDSDAPDYPNSRRS